MTTINTNTHNSPTTTNGPQAPASAQQIGTLPTLQVPGGVIPFLGTAFDANATGEIPERVAPEQLAPSNLLSDLRLSQQTIDDHLSRMQEKARDALTADSAGSVQEMQGDQAPSAGIDPYSLYLNFVSSNPAQRILDQVLSGEFPADFLEGPAGQLQMMVIQNAMQARTNFMNMLSNIMKKNDEAAATAIGNIR